MSVETRALGKEFARAIGRRVISAEYLQLQWNCHYSFNNSAQYEALILNRHHNRNLHVFPEQNLTKIEPETSLSRYDSHSFGGLLSAQ